MPDFAGLSTLFMDLVQHFFDDIDGLVSSEYMALANEQIMCARAVGAETTDTPHLTFTIRIVHEIG